MKKRNGAEPFSLANPARVRAPFPLKLFPRIAETVLGKRYTLSAALLSPSAIRRENRRFRGKDEATGVLAFPLTARSGEILLSPVAAAQESARFGRTRNNFLLFLFIHGLLHLKGLRHGRTMEQREQQLCRQFGI